MELDVMTYKKIIFISVIVVFVWIVYVFYNVGRESLIKKFDHIRSNWKIVLFWFSIIALFVIGYYLLIRFGLVDGYSSE